MVNTLEFIWKHPLGSRQRLRSVAAWICWQLKARARRGPFTVPFVGESRLVVDRGMTGATGNVYVGLHEFEDMAFVLHALRAGDLFGDVGANVGSYTVLAAGVVGSRTVAVEPLPATVAKLARNVAANGMEARVRIEPCAMGAAAGELLFSADRDTMNHVVDSGYGGKIVRVPVRTIDGIFASEAPVVLKVDVEGYEQEVIAGGRRVLSHPDLLAVLLEADGHGVQAAMTGLGFSKCCYDPWTRRLDEAIGSNGARKSANALWVKNRDVVKHRVETASAFSVRGMSI